MSWAIIGLCVAVFGLQFAVPSLRPPGVLLGPAVASGEWWRVPGSLFTHGGALHLLFNMSVVYTLGRVLELGVGSARFAITSVVTGLGAALLVLVFNFEQATVGASGMILGWMGAMLPIATRQGRRELGTWLIQIIVISLLPGVSWAGHLGGFLFGLPMGLLYRLPTKRFWPLAVLLVGLSLALVAVAGTGRLSFGGAP